MIITDKIPPQAVDAEEALLGICLVSPDTVHELKITPEMFYKDSHKKIYEVMVELSRKGPIDIVSVMNRLRDKGELDSIGGPVYLAKLGNGFLSDAMAPIHALVIKEKWLRREYIRVSDEITKSSFDNSIDFADVIEYAESSLFELSDFTQSKEPERIDKCVDQVLAEVVQISNKEKSLVGVPSGFTSIDRITGGWQPGNLIIIAGRPSMGKTALSLTLAMNPAKLNYPVVLFSLEMGNKEIATRFLSSISDYTNVDIRNANVNIDKLSKASWDIASLPIYIDDTPALGLFELRSKVKKLILRSGVKLVIVDYLQLMSAEAGNREQEISKISRGLKAISKEFNIPVIALSQLNRGVEDRADKRPRLSDLRESGAIEQDADIVCFIYRPAYYGMASVRVDGEELNSQGLMIIDGAKDRNGALFSKPLYHNESLTQIFEKNDSNY